MIYSVCIQVTSFTNIYKCKWRVKIIQLYSINTRSIYGGELPPRPFNFKNPSLNNVSNASAPRGNSKCSKFYPWHSGCTTTAENSILYSYVGRNLFIELQTEGFRKHISPVRLTSMIPKTRRFRHVSARERER